MSTLKITLKKSCAGRLIKHKKTAEALGLRKIRQSVTLTETPQIAGMVRKISYMVDVERV
ncbi:MAG: 50S ribosomal protein L30 [Pseudomonadota bacterium]|jgi:large subunit ribosomal protein L30|nr:50S ribosomal protein L30 [Pseudomonadota bacterium]